MANSKIEIPKTYEEAAARKKHVLELINNYNEQLFSGQPPTLSDAEISILQEEYQILDDIVVENVIKADNYEISNLDTVIEKQRPLDKINPLIFLYGFIVILFSSWFMLEKVGLLLFHPFIEDIGEYRFTGFETIYFFYQHREFFAGAANFLIWLVFISFFLVFPLALVGLNFIVRLFFSRNRSNRRAFWWYIVVHFAYFLTNFIILYFETLKSFYQAIIEMLGDFQF